MKRIIVEKFLLCTLYIVTMSLLLAGCNNTNTPEDKTVKSRRLTIKMNDAAGAPVRHMPTAVITDEGSTLLAEWKAGDEVSYCNLSRVNTPGEALIIGTMKAASSGVKSDLNGDVECTADDYIAVVYPSVDMSASSYEMGNGIHGRFTISLAGQDGSLSKLASTYHYVYGRAHVESVTGTTATATMDKMQSLLTICKFSFVEKDNESAGALPINTLTISYGGWDSKTGKYPQSANVEVTNLTENSEAQAVGATPSEALTINAAGATEVYVALLPESDKVEYKFTVTSGSNTYTGTAEAHLKKGEYVKAPNLKLAAN